MPEKKRILVTLVIVCLFVLHSQAWPKSIAIIGATVIDGNGGEPLKDAVIVIDGKRISAIGPRTSIKVPANADIIDAKGKFVLHR